MDFSLLQEHTIRLYDLENHPFTLKKVKARSLLSVQRFDLFAKLYYARHRQSNPQLAQEVYLKHIKAFNPDGREPGRTDKTSFGDFFKTFDELLDDFEIHAFDETKSIVPLSSEGIILDGGHRVAALAFYDKEITVAVFEDVHPVCQFDYQYFKQRGLPQYISDIIANEILYWMPNCMVACMWPRMGSNQQKAPAVELLNRMTIPFYQKSIEVNLSSLTLFMAKVYRMQSWVGTEANHYSGAKDKALNCYKKGNHLDLLFFTTSLSLEELLVLKEDIRNLYPYGKHSIHITDNSKETEDVAYFTLQQQGLEQWLYMGNGKGWKLAKRKLRERIYIFRHTYWIDMKVWVAKMIGYK